MLYILEMAGTVVSVLQRCIVDIKDAHGSSISSLESLQTYTVLESRELGFTVLGAGAPCTFSPLQEPLENPVMVI